MKKNEVIKDAFYRIEIIDDAGEFDAVYIYENDLLTTIIDKNIINLNLRENGNITLKVFKTIPININNL